MNIFNKVNEIVSTKEINEEFEPKFVSKSKKTWKHYYKIVNPETGERYKIPMLKHTDSDYPIKYADMMKFKEINPEGFNAIMEWN